MQSSNPKPLCKFCNLAVEYGPGFIMTETSDGSGFICHEECWQLSGEDDGYIAKLHSETDGYGL